MGGRLASGARKQVHHGLLATVGLAQGAESPLRRAAVEFGPIRHWTDPECFS